MLLINLVHAGVRF